MPLGPNIKYRFKKGSKVRLAFKDGEVIEAKNTESGATHTPAEFAADRAKARRRQAAAKALGQKAPTHR